MHRTAQHTFVFILAFLLSACDGSKGEEAASAEPATNDPNALLEELDQRIIASPRDASLFAERARLNERRDSSHLALNDWNRAIALDSTNSKYHTGIGDLYFQKVRLDHAERHLRKASTLDPKATEPRLKIAEIKLLQREYPEAMGWANDALRIDQLNAQGYFLKGYIHMEAGDTALAISSYRTAIEQDPKMHRAFLQLGLLHAELGDPLAMQYYNSALELEPASTETLYGLAMFAQENGMDSLALHCYDRIKRIAPENVLAYYNTGYVLLENMKEPEAARKEFTQAIAMAPLFVEAYFNRGLTYELDGRLDSAYTDYRQALAIQPDYTPAAHGMGRLQSKGLKIAR